MPHKIDPKKCINCGSCAINCPNQAIKQDKDGQYKVDPKLCIDCGVCESICQQDAIKLE